MDWNIKLYLKKVWKINFIICLWKKQTCQNQLCNNSHLHSKVKKVRNELGQIGDCRTNRMIYRMKGTLIACLEVAAGIENLIICGLSLCMASLEVPWELPAWAMKQHTRTPLFLHSLSTQALKYKGMKYDIF